MFPSAMFGRLVVASIFVVGLVSQGAFASQLHRIASDVHQRLINQIADEGSAAVIVELVVPGIEKLDDRGRQRQIHEKSTQLQSELRDTNFKIVRQFDWSPYTAIQVSYEAFDALLRNPNVARVHEDRLNSPLLYQTTDILGDYQNASYYAGSRGPYNGKGWSVAVLDTGVDRNHIFLKHWSSPSVFTSKVVDEACYSAPRSSTEVTYCPNGQTSQTGTGAGAPCTGPSDCYHGTAVAGIAAGKSNGSEPAEGGVASGATIIAIQVFHRENSSTRCSPDPAPCSRTRDSDYIAGLERVYELRGTYNIAAANLSLGGVPPGGACDTHPAKETVDRLRAAGIATVAAAGNNSSKTGLSAPACISTVVAVGASDKSDRFVYMSNVGPGLDFYAPGYQISLPTPCTRLSGCFVVRSGTSFAAPHLTGAWAVIKQRSPTASVDTILSKIELGSTVSVYDSLSGIRRKRIDVSGTLNRF